MVVVKTIALSGMVFPIAFTNGAMVELEMLTKKSAMDVMAEIESGSVSFSTFSQLAFCGVSNGYKLIELGIGSVGNVMIRDKPGWFDWELLSNYMGIGDFKQVSDALTFYMPKADADAGNDLPQNQEGQK